MGGRSLFGIPLNFTIGEYGNPVTKSGELVEAIKTARGDAEAASFFETFTKMFSQGLPDGLDAGLLGETMGQWENFWIFPGIMAGAVLVIFAAAFWDRTIVEDESSDSAGESPEGTAPAAE